MTFPSSTEEKIIICIIFSTHWSVGVFVHYHMSYTSGVHASQTKKYVRFSARAHREKIYMYTLLQ